MVVVVAKQIPQASVNIIVDHKNALESRVGLAFRPLFIPLPQVPRVLPVSPFSDWVVHHK
jgi:hypothetical protein